MRLSVILFRASLLALCPAILATVGLYLYPALLGCSFPKPPYSTSHDASARAGVDTLDSKLENGSQAPFRLLALGDPQIEGDSSLPKSGTVLFPSLQRLQQVLQAPNTAQFLKDIVFDSLARDLPDWLRYCRKRLDLLGNDYYLAHIYRTMHWWSEPTHVAVLGDLIGSQWVSDDEFQRRSWRYWNRVFRHGQRIDEDIMHSSTTEVLGQDQAWSRRVINIAGNHDIGYAGDINRRRLERFEREYGRVNWDVDFELHTSGTTSASLNRSASSTLPSLRIVVLNDMNLDGPVLDSLAQTETYQYMNDLISGRLRPVEDRTSAIVLLTHIPLEKQAGVCVDGPYFTYRDTGVREQNHLSSQSSKHVLEGIFGKSNKVDAPAKGLGRNGIILTGHDHEGCDVYHYTDPPQGRSNLENGTELMPDASSAWKSKVWLSATAFFTSIEIPGIREITLRSMMGSYGGYAGMLSAWFDEEMNEWRFEHAYCPLGVQHIWWAVHITDLIVALSLLSSSLYCIIESATTSSNVSRKRLSASTTKHEFSHQTTKEEQVSSSTGSQVFASSSRTVLRRK